MRLCAVQEDGNGQVLRNAGITGQCGYCRSGLSYTLGNKYS